MNVIEQKDTLESIKDLIKRRRLQMLVHSYIYYKLDDSLVSDTTFDIWAEELIDLQKRYPEISRDVELYDIFADFTMIGDVVRLPLDDDPKLAHRAKHLLKMDKINRGRGKSEQ